jgi:hypothetical protein
MDLKGRPRPVPHENYPAGEAATAISRKRVLLESLDSVDSNADWSRRTRGPRPAGKQAFCVLRVFVELILGGT